MRTFIAVDLDARFVDDVAALGESLRGHARLSSARWVARGAMHVTLRFLGETSDEGLPAVRELVTRLVARAAFVVRAASLLAFPDARRARVLGAALACKGRELASLASDADAAALALGYAAETRAYRPHLTLARLREPADLRAVVAETLPTVADGRVTGITLFQSLLGPDGPTYTPLARGTFER